MIAHRKLKKYSMNRWIFAILYGRIESFHLDTRLYLFVFCLAVVVHVHLANADVFFTDYPPGYLPSEDKTSKNLLGSATSMCCSYCHIHKYWLVIYWLYSSLLKATVPKNVLTVEFKEVVCPSFLLKLVLNIHYKVCEVKTYSLHTF